MDEITVEDTKKALGIVLYMVAKQTNVLAK
jgi:hypothetical protein